MSRLHLLVLVACLTFLAEGPVRDEPPSGDDSARSLIDKAIRARGGEVALTRFPAFTWKGRAKIHAGGRSFRTTDEGAEDLPERLWGRSQWEENGTAVRETLVVTGGRGWTVRDGKLEAMDKAEVAELRERMHSEWLTRLTPLKDKDYRLELLGVARVGDRPALGVRVSREGHRDVRLYFDKESGLLLKEEYRIKVVQTGREYTEEVFYGDYKDVRGAKYAMHRTLRSGDNFSSEVDLTEVKPCEKLDDALFVRPEN